MSMSNTKSLKNIKLPLALAIGLGLAANMALAADGIKAAYVETVIPSKAVSYRTIVGAGKTQGVGPGTGVFGVSSITISNYDATVAQVFIYSARTSTPGDCSTVSQNLPGVQPEASILVQPFSTLHLTYPSPMAFSPNNGSTCMGINYEAGVTYVDVSVNGFVN